MNFKARPTAHVMMYKIMLIWETLFFFYELELKQKH